MASSTPDTAAGRLRFGVPVLERLEAGIRDAIFDRVDLNSPDWHKAWHTDWKAIRATGGAHRDASAVVDRGRAEVSQSFALPEGDRITSRIA